MLRTKYYYHYKLRGFFDFSGFLWRFDFMCICLLFIGTLMYDVPSCLQMFLTVGRNTNLYRMWNICFKELHVHWVLDCVWVLLPFDILGMLECYNKYVRHTGSLFFPCHELNNNVVLSTSVCRQLYQGCSFLKGLFVFLVYLGQFFLAWYM